jgi:hypothetical protein
MERTPVAELTSDCSNRVTMSATSWLASDSAERAAYRRSQDR